MRLYEWLYPEVGDYDLFIVADKREMNSIVSQFGDTAKTVSIRDEYYYFVNTQRKTISPLPFLALAFGGQYDESPVGKQIFRSSLDLKNYQLTRCRI